MVYGNKSGNEKRLALDIASFVLDKKKQPIILCVGSDKVVGDTLGVLVGELLKNNPAFKGRVYGDLKEPITRLNILKTIEKIRTVHKDNPIIVVDAVLGSEEEVGCVKTHKNGIFAGGQFGKGHMVGDYSILGVVCCKGVSALSFLGSVRLKIVVELSKKIASSIEYSSQLCLGL